MIALIKRHIKLFFKDKASVFFSLFSVFIIIALYLLFLSENLTSNLPEFKDQSAFVFLWMFAGIIAVTTATASLGAFGKFIEDKVSKKSEDFLITQITSRQLAYSYIFYSFIIGLTLTILLLIFGYSYTFITVDIILKFSLTLIVIVMLSTFMHTLFFYLMTSYLKTMSAFSGLSTVVGTLIGFLAGIYIPIGLLPSYLQKVITLFPTTHVIALLKDLLMIDVLEAMKTIMPTEAYDELVVMLGIKLQWNDNLLSTTFSWYYVIGLTLCLLVLVLVKNRK